MSGLKEPYRSSVETDEATLSYLTSAGSKDPSLYIPVLEFKTKILPQRGQHMRTRKGRPILSKGSTSERFQKINARGVLSSGKRWSECFEGI